tara:strand:+ start:337 stop:1281 length:945 start_codon:yes stop_codon:yes gene_type:complete
MNLSVRDVAVRLNVSEKTVYKWLKLGHIPASRIGKSWIITSESIQSIIRPKASHISADSDRISDPIQYQPIKKSIHPLESITEGESEHLQRFTNLLNGAVSQGLLGVLGPRSSDPKTIGLIAQSLDSAKGEILLQGIGLREFFGDRGHTPILQKMALEDKPVQLRAILVNPVSEFARARAILEDGSQFQNADRFKSSPLYNDSWRSLNVIAAMKKDAAACAQFGLDVRFVDHWPSVYLVMTKHITYIETYHFGRPEVAVDGSSIDGLVPMFQFKTQSTYASIMRQHFNYIWSGANPYIRTYSLGEISEAMQIDV